MVVVQRNLHMLCVCVLIKNLAEEVKMSECKSAAVIVMLHVITALKKK